ncbi:hypothetical protein GCM10022216_04340 [Sphingobacterium kyonggiense]|uniref:Uncharacterized protein n=1 Tax=Sphingobacterium kyonggiense TaxID=714075 RepID=A0ABP7YBS3_9SPHI
MSEDINASITSPEQGAQQECSNNFFPSLGKESFSLSNSLFSMGPKIYSAMLQKTMYLFKLSILTSLNER